MSSNSFMRFVTEVRTEVACWLVSVPEGWLQSYNDMLCGCIVSKHAHPGRNLHRECHAPRLKDVPSQPPQIRASAQEAHRCVQCWYVCSRRTTEQVASSTLFPVLQWTLAIQLNNRSLGSDLASGNKYHQSVAGEALPTVSVLGLLLQSMLDMTAF